MNGPDHNNIFCANLLSFSFALSLLDYSIIHFKLIGSRWTERWRDPWGNCDAWNIVNIESFLPLFSSLFFLSPFVYWTTYVGRGASVAVRLTRAPTVRSSWQRETHAGSQRSLPSLRSLSLSLYLKWLVKGTDSRVRVPPTPPSTNPPYPSFDFLLLSSSLHPCPLLLFLSFCLPFPPSFPKKSDSRS